MKSLIERGYLAKREVLDEYGRVLTEYKVTRDGYEVFEKKISAEGMFSIHRIWRLPIIVE